MHTCLHCSYYLIGRTVILRHFNICASGTYNVNPVTQGEITHQRVKIAHLYQNLEYTIYLYIYSICLLSKYFLSPDGNLITVVLSLYTNTFSIEGLSFNYQIAKPIPGPKRLLLSMNL